MGGDLSDANVVCVRPFDRLRTNGWGRGRTHDPSTPQTEVALAMWRVETIRETYSGSPAVSGIPSIRFRFWMATPLAPLPRLSNRPINNTWPEECDTT